MHKESRIVLKDKTDVNNLLEYLLFLLGLLLGQLHFSNILNIEREIQTCMTKLR